jgi:DNA polymerase-1
MSDYKWITPTTQEAYQFLHDGVLALADVEANGIKIDTALLDRNIEKVVRKIRRVETNLKNNSIWKQWVKQYGRDANLGSRPQLGTILSKNHGDAWTDDDRTPTGKPKMDENTLSRIDIPFIQEYLRMQKLQKVLSTYLMGIKREVHNGYLHPVFSLHLARTFRSSSDSPNFQNMPIRIPWVSELIRPVFVAEKDYQLIELDFKGIEVCISACYNKDPNLIKYIKNTELDMHRDMAAELFKLDQDDVTKQCRYSAKNAFVFPQFYGDWYVSCAKSLWDYIGKLKLTTKDGTPMLDHLKTMGIMKLGLCVPKEKPKKGTFEHHVQEVEHRFWFERFKVYREWKESWHQKYQSRGRLTMKTGFTIEGFYSRNDVINYPVQGAAFHCLLWSLIKINDYLKRHRMRTKIVGQIHDSLLTHVHKDEREQFLRIAKRIMTQELVRHWPWIIVPLTVEAEASPLGGNWFEKKVIEI